MDKQLREQCEQVIFVGPEVKTGGFSFRFDPSEKRTTEVWSAAAFSEANEPGDAVGGAQPWSLYRYQLYRRWAAGGEMVLFVMLNPSTATHEANDPTISKCMRYAWGWGFSGMEVANAFALRATDPKKLRTSAAPIGPLNNDALLTSAMRATRIVCAWGKHAALGQRGRAVAQLLREVGDLHCLATNGDGSPQHPLYLDKTLRPVPFAEALRPFG